MQISKDLNEGQTSWKMIHYISLMSMIEEKDIYFSNDSNYRNLSDCFSSTRGEAKNVVFPKRYCRKRQYLELSFCGRKEYAQLWIRSKSRRTSILMYHLEDFVNPTECNFDGYQLLHFIWQKKMKGVIEVRIVNHIQRTIYWWSWQKIFLSVYLDDVKLNGRKKFQEWSWKILARFVKDKFMSG